MPANAGMPLPSYTITSIVPENDFNPAAGTVPSHRVSFTTADNISSSVLVPNTQIADLGAVKAAVEGMIMALAAIKRLGQY